MNGEVAGFTVDRRLTVTERRQWQLASANDLQYGWLWRYVPLQSAQRRSAIAACVRDLADLHEAGRGRVVLTSDGTARLSVDHVGIELQEEPLEADLGDEEALDRLVEERLQSMDLLQAPSAAFVVGKGRPQAVCLLVHHVIADATGLSVLLSDLRHLLAGRTVSQPALGLSDLPTRRLHAREEPNLQHWIASLGRRGSGSPFERLPAYQPLPHRGVRLTLSRSLVERIELLSATTRISMPGMIHAVVAQLLLSYDGTSSPVLQSVVSNRWHPDLAGVAANVVNVGYVPFDRGASVGEVLKTAARGHLESMRHGWFDRLNLHGALADDPANRYNADISAIVNVRMDGQLGQRPDQVAQNEHNRVADLDDLHPPVDPSRSRNCHLHVFGDVGAGALQLGIYASAMLSEIRGPREIAEDLLRCFDLLADGPDGRLSSLPINVLE